LLGLTQRESVLLGARVHRGKKSKYEPRLLMAGSEKENPVDRSLIIHKQAHYMNSK
jgi:hypothetical protein